MIELDGVAVRAGEQAILQDVSFALDSGTACSVLGANGAGKSTLLGAMGGDIALDRGRVLLGGRGIEAWPLTERAHVMGVLHQDTGIDFPFEVAEVVLMGRTPHTDVTMRENLAICTEVIEALIREIVFRISK